MKLKELLCEQPVLSSWISELNYDPEEQMVILVLKGGKSYEFPGIPQKLYNKWLKAPSKGKFYWRKIKPLMQ